MAIQPVLKSGGQVLVECLIRQQVDKVFCVPGESYLAVLDGFFEQKDKIQLINTCHEAGASNMAEAYGKLTGNAGIAFVTRGPGACHASVGVHIAKQDSTPMVLFIGQVPSNVFGREAFQEIDYVTMFSKVSKWCEQIPSAENIEEYVMRAFEIALSGRQGPVVLSLPEDFLGEKIVSKELRPNAIIKNSVSEKELLRLKELLIQAEKPIILLGGSGWSKETRRGIKIFSDYNSIPVVTSFRRQDRVDNRFKNFVGTLGTSVSPKLSLAFMETDLVLAIGARLSDMTTNHYQLFGLEQPHTKIVHIYPEKSEINRVFPVELGVVANTSEAVTKLEKCLWFSQPKWNMWLERLRTEYLEDMKVVGTKSPVDLASICYGLNYYLSKNSIITLDAGNHTGWPQRFIQFHENCLQIGTTCGSMGYSIPAAVAASLVFPNEQVISFVGDGGFLMSGLEISTAIQQDLNLVIIIVNNSSYGTIRMHQEFKYPKRVIGTNINNPDFVALARSMGAYAEKVTTTDEFFRVFERVIKVRQVSVIEVVVSKELISSRFDLTDIQKF